MDEVNCILAWTVPDSKCLLKGGEMETFAKFSAPSSTLSRRIMVLAIASPYSLLSCLSEPNILLNLRVLKVISTQLAPTLSPAQIVTDTVLILPGVKRMAILPLTGNLWPYTYLPWNQGMRFWVKAFTPSWKSPVKTMLLMASVSASSCSSRPALQEFSKRVLTRP